MRLALRQSSQDSHPGSDESCEILCEDQAWVFGIPWPRWLAPSIEAEYWPGEPTGWRVRVLFRVPLLGLVAAYEGDVTPKEPTSESPLPTGPL